MKGAKRLSTDDVAKARAEAKGVNDYLKGNSCNPAKYGAQPGSKWEEWYTAGYQEFKEAEELEL